MESYLQFCGLHQIRRWRVDVDKTEEWIAAVPPERRTPPVLAEAAASLAEFDHSHYLQFVKPEPFGYWLRDQWLYLIFVLVYGTLSWLLAGWRWDWIIDAGIMLTGLWYVRSKVGYDAIAGGFIAFALWKLGASFSPWIQGLSIVTLLITGLVTWFSIEEITKRAIDRVIVFGLLFYLLWVLGGDENTIRVTIAGYSFAVIRATALISLGFFLDGLPGFIIGSTSRATDDEAHKASDQYQQVLQQKQDAKVAGFTCYGHVVRDDPWTVLQYHYFYPFNDWRSQANGLNQHEADWEMIAVFLRTEEEIQFDPDDDTPPAPYGVAYSQHHEGDFRHWPDLEKAQDGNGRSTTHPVVYVALGSHANYPEKGEFGLSDYFQPSRGQSLIILFDFLLQLPRRFLGYMRELIPYLWRWLRAFLSQGINTLTQTMTADAFVQPYPRPRAFPAMRPLTEKATGNGRLLTPLATDPFSRCKLKLINDEAPPWVNYPGLWGDNTLLQDESGPPGPKWERPRDRSQNTRLRWESPALWLERLDRHLVTDKRSVLDKSVQMFYSSHTSIRKHSQE